MTNTETNQVETITAQELERRIAEAREPMPSAPLMTGSAGTRTSEGREWVTSYVGFDAAKIECIHEWVPAKQYATDANAALELLDEAPDWQLEKETDGYYRCIICNEEDKGFVAWAKTACEAACTAWLLCFTGQRVEVVE